MNFEIMSSCYWRSSTHCTLCHHSIRIDFLMARAIKGMLIKCDPSIKSLIVRIDMDYRDIIIEELDDTHLLIDPTKLVFVKKELNRILADNSYNPFDDEE